MSEGLRAWNAPQTRRVFLCDVSQLARRMRSRLPLVDEQGARATSRRLVAQQLSAIPPRGVPDGTEMILVVP